MTCIRCGAKGTTRLLPLEVEACADCERAWLREESCSVEAVEKAVGVWRLEMQGFSEHHKRFTAELLKRTLAWSKAAA